MSLYETLYEKYPEHQEELEERAAIVEHASEITRKRAETCAAIRIKYKYRLEDDKK